MGAPTHTICICTLPDEEGDLTVLVGQWDKPKEEDILDHKINSHTVTHGECGVVELVHVTPTKQVLCCNRCLLRIPLSRTVETLKDLRNLFS